MQKVGSPKPSKHQGSKRGYKHAAAKPSKVVETVEIVDNNTGETTHDHIVSYKHGRTYGKKIRTNHDRVTAGRIKRDLLK